VQAEPIEQRLGWRLVGVQPLVERDQRHALRGRGLGVVEHRAEAGRERTRHAFGQRRHQQAAARARQQARAAHDAALGQRGGEVERAVQRFVVGVGRQAVPRYLRQHGAQRGQPGVAFGAGAGAQAHAAQRLRRHGEQRER
jgi:hypothetical protein